jgi:hypothetical protein
MVLEPDRHQLVMIGIDPHVSNQECGTAAGLVDSLVCES